MTPRRTKQSGWSSIFAAPDEWRAQIVKDALLEEAIPVIIQTHCVPGYGTALNPGGRSWGDVMVPNTCRLAALHVLASILGDELK